ncbi:MAG: hypothetical protein ACR2QC_04210 [Gammaproteobacteria bacterium]
MANEVLVKHGAQLLFADHATDFGSAPATAANSLIIGTPTNVQIDLTGVAASGGARQAAKADLTTPRALRWSVSACLEFETAPADGGEVGFFWASSPSSTAGTGNPGGTTGSDAAFTDTDGNLGQMQYIGSLYVRNNVINIGFVGIFVPQFQYGNLVIVNRASTALRSTATAMDETHIVMNELIDEIQ